MKFPITRNPNTRFDSIDWNKLGFGVYFSDHIFISKYKDGNWDGGQILPYGPMEFEPALCTFHYAQSCFEGLKTFHCLDKSGKPTGYANLFRPDKNAARLNLSGERLCIPNLDIDFQIEAMKELVKIDQKFIPSKRGESLYLRPFIFGSSNFLGVQASAEYNFIICTSPVSSYYANGLEPIKILVSDKYVRAVRGGLGFTKAAANYAASLYGGKKAKEEGFSQVLWLDGVELKYVDEVGAMNIMFVIDGEIVTPTLEQGSILGGVTRMSVIELAKDMGLKVSERRIAFEEVVEAHEAGKLTECFGTGTAAIISPVGQLTYKGVDMIINNSQIGPISQKLYDAILDIQYSEEQDKRNWTVKFKL
ncbi:MAG: branched-chain amino acid aminotransferase [Ignavibacteria bacterium]|jgi:branched-chain amino acid aminotransferase|nr:branched-chain amino acid aminotransferase [Ignavibacteria bacterium]